MIAANIVEATVRNDFIQFLHLEVKFQGEFSLCYAYFKPTRLTSTTVADPAGGELSLAGVCPLVYKG